MQDIDADGASLIAIFPFVLPAKRVNCARIVMLLCICAAICRNSNGSMGVACAARVVHERGSRVGVGIGVGLLLLGGDQAIGALVGRHAEDYCRDLSDREVGVVVATSLVA